MPVKETSGPAQARAYVGTEYSVALNSDFRAQTEQVAVGGSTLTARVNYYNDTALACAGHGATCGASKGSLPTLERDRG